MVHDVKAGSRIIASNGGGVEETKPDAAVGSGASGQTDPASRFGGRDQQCEHNEGGHQVPRDPGDDPENGGSLP